MMIRYLKVNYSTRSKRNKVLSVKGEANSAKLLSDMTKGFQK